MKQPTTEDSNESPRSKRYIKNKSPLSNYHKENERRIKPTNDSPQGRFNKMYAGSAARSLINPEPVVPIGRKGDESYKYAGFVSLKQFTEGENAYSKPGDVDFQGRVKR